MKKRRRRNSEGSVLLLTTIRAALLKRMPLLGIRHISFSTNTSSLKKSKTSTSMKTLKRQNV